MEAELSQESPHDQIDSAHFASVDAGAAAYEPRVARQPHPHQLQQLSVGGHI